MVDSIVLDPKDTAEETTPTFDNPNSPAEQAEVLRILERVNKMYENQSRNWHEFNDRSLKYYCDDNERRINNYVEPRGEDIDDWQTRGFEGITREKMFAFVSKVAMRRPDYRFKAVDKSGFVDRIVSEVSKDIYDYTWNLEDPVGMDFFLDAWQAAGMGTVIRYEGIEQIEEIDEDFESYDVKTGEIKGLTETVRMSDINCRARRIKPLNFLIGDWYEPDVQRQPYLTEIADMSREQFDYLFGGYKHAEEVPHLEEIRSEWPEAFYAEQWNNVNVDRVRVIHYYEKAKRTKYRVIANGVLILATPFPRKDKKYPFSKGIFKLFANEKFFWGKALPDEIASDQDLYNSFKNMVMDRAILYVQRPLIGTNLTEIENDIFRPNGILNVKGGALTTMDYEAPGNADIQILEYLRGSVDYQTSDSTQSGQAGSGSTAREIVIADENARKLMGVFRLFLEDFDLRAAKLRVGNIMQFFFEPTKLKDLIGEEDTKELDLVYRSFSLENRYLSDKKKGTRMINVVGKKEDLPTKDELDGEEMASKAQGYEMEKLVITSEYIKNFNVDLMIIPESSFEQSRSLELALETDYIQTVAQFFPNQFQQYSDLLFNEYNDVYEKDTSDFEKIQKNQLSSPSPSAPAEPAPGSKPGPSVSQQISETEAPSLAQLTGAGL
jgi:hypothetical protein